MNEKFCREYDGDYSDFENRDAKYANYTQRDFDALFETEKKRIEQMREQRKKN